MHVIFAVILSSFQPSPSFGPSPAAALEQARTYRTYVHERFQSFGYAGTLQLRYENGYIQGTYRPDTGGGIEPVSGGYKGTKVWLDFRMLNQLHVEGTIEKNGDISGIGASLSAKNSLQYVFNAKQQANP